MPHRILLIEDDPCIASLLSYPLSREGYSVTCANRNQSGLMEAKNRLYDLIVYDMEHTETEFPIFVRNLQQHLIGTPILILSAIADEALIARCLRLGADDYMVKPFGVDHFLARIHTLLRRSTKACLRDNDALTLETGAAIEVGNLRIFPAKYEVMCSGTKLTLPTKEFELLLRLAECKGAVVSKNDLAHLFGPAVNPKSCRKVDVYICSIRKKFQPFDSVRIEAVRGRGYKLVASKNAETASLIF